MEKLKIKCKRCDNEADTKSIALFNGWAHELINDYWVCKDCFNGKKEIQSKLQKGIQNVIL